LSRGETLEVAVRTGEIRLDQFLKLAQAVSAGGEAKIRIQAGEVKVNGEVESRRGRKLHGGDVVELEGGSFRVSSGA
jgi:ribosome-associated protein